MRLKVSHISTFTIALRWVLPVVWLFARCSNQPSIPSNVALSNQFSIATHQYRAGQFDSAIIHYDRAIDQTFKAGQWDTLIRYSYPYAVALERLQKPKHGYPFFNRLERALNASGYSDSMGITDFYRSKMIIYLNDNKTDSAIYIGKQAYRILSNNTTYPNHRFASLLDIMQVAYEASGDLYNSLKVGLECLDCCEKMNVKYVDIPWVIGNVAEIYKSLGIYDLAEKYAYKSLDSFRILMINQADDSKDSYYATLQFYAISRGEYEQALSVLKKLYSNYKSGSQAQVKGIITKEIIDAYDKMDVPDSMLTYALEMYRSAKNQFPGQYHQIILNSALITSMAHLKAGNASEAYRYNQIAGTQLAHLPQLSDEFKLRWLSNYTFIQLYKEEKPLRIVSLMDRLIDEYIKKYGRNSDETGELTYRKAEMLQSTGARKQALQSYLSALQVFKSTKPEGNPTLKNCELNCIQLFEELEDSKSSSKFLKRYTLSNNTAGSLADARYHLLYARYLNKSNRIINSNEIARHYASFDTIYEKVIRHFAGYFSPTLLGKYNLSIGYKEAAAYYADLFERNKDPKDIEQSFIFSEKYRLTGYRLTTQSKLIQQFANLPPALLNLENTLKNNINYYASLINSVQSDTFNQKFISQWQLDLQFNQNRADSLTGVIQLHYPEYFKLKYSKINLSSQNIIRVLRKDQQFIEFLEYGDFVYVYSLVGKMLRLNKLVFSGDIRDQLKRINTYYLSGDIQMANKCSEIIYRQLIKPIINQDQSEIVFVLDGLLSNISYEGLATDTVAPKYLLETKNISYALSGYAYADQTISNVATNRNLIISPGFEDQTKSDYLRYAGANGMMVDSVYLHLIRQPFMQQTASELSSQYQISNLNGKVATEFNFRRLKKEFNILNFASHALLNEADPLVNSIALNKDNFEVQSDSTDGYLHVAEIYGIPIKSNLVILTGCETGKGAFSDGIGVVSLAHAFNYAGCKNAVVSLWPIDEEASAKIMKLFYNELHNGKPPYQALYAAKKEFIRLNKQFASPFFWSGIVLYGTYDAQIVLRENQSNQTLTLYFVIAILCGLVFFFVFMYRRSYEK